MHIRSLLILLLWMVGIGCTASSAAAPTGITSPPISDVEPTAAPQATSPTQPTTAASLPAPTQAVIPVEALPIQWAEDVIVQIEGDFMIIEADGIPDHDYNESNVQVQHYRFRLPLNPEIAPQPSEAGRGPIGIMIDGAVLFNPFNAEGQDAVLYEQFDSCLGHPDPRQGAYHYHQTPICLTQRVDVPGQHSRLIGFLLDGFPIYGPQGDDGFEMTGLDACNGHFGATPEYPAGIYHYHTRLSFAYVPLCFSGTAERQPGGPPGSPSCCRGTNRP